MRSTLRGTGVVLRRCAQIAAAMAVSWLVLFALANSTSSASSAATGQQKQPVHPKWQSTKQFGAWDNGGYVVYNNEWNTSQAGPQTIWADSFGHWGIRSDQASTTSVKTYPCVQVNYQSVPYTKLTYLRSEFTQTMPSSLPGLDAEAAYDIWLDNYKIEVMVWVDNVGQTPAGSVVAHMNFWGEHFLLYKVGRPFFSFVLQGKPQTTGKVHLLSAIRYLVRHHYLRKQVVLTQADFGWEIASTGNVPANFTVTKYWLQTGIARHHHRRRHHH